ncbi:hypothetical protein ACT1WM_22290, partial [Bacillus stercoris]|uniref:hypothetical protein n=1 Tax=Bacillus stercoris TaxID=2054641 RepID=UPI00402A8595
RSPCQKGKLIPRWGTNSLQKPKEKGEDQMNNIEIYKDLKELEEAYTGSHGTKTFYFGTVYVEAEKLAVSLYDNAMRIYSLTNALKRGKTVKKHVVNFFASTHIEEKEVIHMYMDSLNISFSELIIKAISNDLPDMEMGSNRSVNNIHEEEKAVRVFSPFTKPKKVNPHTKWTIQKVAKAILAEQITKGVRRMTLTDDYAYDAAVNFRKGEIMDLVSFARDLIERPYGWWVRVDEVTDKTMKLSVSCHHFDYRTLYVSL